MTFTAQDVDGKRKVYVDRWDPFATFTLDLIAKSSYMEHNGYTVKITIDNGSATYRIMRKINDWQILCQLRESTWSAYSA